MYSVFRECDAIIVTTSYAYESAPLDAMKQWYSDMQKDVHVLGPLLPSNYGTETQNSASVDIEMFLEEMQVQHGKRSVFFASLSPFFRFQVQITTTHEIFPDFLWHSLLALSSGIH
jgi:hypothetical protein